MFKIKHQKAGDHCLDHGKKFSTRERAILWMTRECISPGGSYTARGEDFKADYRGYPEDLEDGTCFVVYYEAEPESNEFGLVLP